MKALADRFVLRPFKFSSAASRVGSPADLTFNGPQTKLGAALDGVRQELAGLPLAGVVLVSDGADTTDQSLSDALLALKAAAVPVFTVGVGRDRLARDVQIDRVSTPRKALKGTSLVVDAVVTQTGYAGETVSLEVEDEGRIVGSQAVTLPADGEPAAVRVRFIASDAGTRLFRFRIAPRPGELVTQNNVRDALIDVSDRAERILYYEGEPRPEMKFLNRAVAEDKNLQVITLQRTADNKYLRFNVDNAEQLAVGLPEDARRAVRLPGADPRQHRGRRVHRRSAPHDRRVRRTARRRAADAGRSARVCRRQLRRDAGRRRPAGDLRSRRARRSMRCRSPGCACTPRAPAKPTASRRSPRPRPPRPSGGRTCRSSRA